MITARKLGSNGPAVSALGLGTMGMSAMYGHADRSESIATVHAALDAGVNLLDAVHAICDLQIEYSLISRGIEETILPACRELGVGVTAYGVLSRGLISGHWTKDRQVGRDFRAGAPRFQGENLDRNLQLVEQLRTLAEAKGVTVAQIAIAWVLHRGEDIVPLVGSRTRAQLTEALAALDVSLSAADLAAIEATVPKNAAAGERYPEHGMQSLDSERASR